MPRTLRTLLALLVSSLAAAAVAQQGAAPAPPPGAFADPSTRPPANRPPGATPLAPGAAPAAAAGQQPSAPPPPLPLESWRFNARERTGRGLAAWKSEKPAEAVAALDTAARLRPADPLAAYNSGTAHLGAGLGVAAEILERSITAAPPELAPDGYYNLGNARLAAQEAGGAVDAYKETLRRSPGHAGARRNLELALKMLEEQQKQQQQQQQNQDQNQDSKDQKGKGNPDSKSQPDPKESGQQEPDPSSQGDPQQGDGQPQPQQGAGSERDKALPQFKDQQDMNAEQAASILQAVENLERERRREEAKARARAKTSVEKDW